MACPHTPIRTSTYLHWCHFMPRRTPPFFFLPFLVVQIDIRDRDDNKEVSLSTSKINYMDPRVSVAWCKRHEVPVEKVTFSL